MRVKALDLSRDYPRSPREILGGYDHLARMIDKARAKAAGTLGEYIYPCPMDQTLLDFVGIGADAFYEAVQERTDAGILDWLQRKAKNRSREEIAEWNRAIRNRKPETGESMNYFLETRNRIDPRRTDVTTWVDLLDLEEGRKVPVRKS
jgi:hypothetical protein